MRARLADPRIVAALVILLQPLLLLWPLPRVFRDSVLAAPDQEAAAHIWGLWAAIHEGQPLLLETKLLAWPDGVSLVLVDPLHLLPFGLGLPLGVGAAYNLVLVQGVMVMGLAGALLARRVGAPPWLGALLAGFTPTLLANAADGMTEGFGVGWVGVQLALLLDFMDDGRPRTGILAALALAACAWTGPYNALWAAILDLAVAAWALREPARFGRAAMVGLGGLLAASPVIAAVLGARSEELPGGAIRAGLPKIVENTAIFRGGVQTGADLLDAWLPGPLTGAEAEVSHTTYLGLTVLIAALFGLDRRRWPWLLGALAFVVLSWGPWPYLAGKVLGGAEHPRLAPAGLATLALPPLGRVTRWYRAGAVASLMLVPLAAAGLGRLGRLRGALTGLVLADLLFLAPHAWPLHSTPLPDPAPWAKLEGEGAILEIPLVSSATPPPGAWRDQLGVTQPQHGHPVGGTIMALAPAEAARSAQRAVEALLKEGHLDTRALRDFRYLAIQLHYRKLQPEALARLEACFGPPVGRSEATVVFDLGSPRCGG